MRAARIARKKRGGWLTVGGFAAALVGLGMVAAYEEDPDSFTAGEAVGFSLAFGGLIAGVVGVYYLFRVDDENASAFATYDDGLRERLHLCVDGMPAVSTQIAPP
jgi:hypothetical protein